MLGNSDLYGNLIVAGWGKTENGYSEAKWNDDLSKLDHTYVSNENCTKEWRSKVRKTFKVPGSQICATGKQLESDSCNGDSGGPLMALNKISGQMEVIGIISYGVRQCNSKKPTIHTRVGTYLDWINEFIDNSANK